MKVFHMAFTLMAVSLLLLSLVCTQVFSAVAYEDFRTFGISGLLDNFPKGLMLRQTFRLDASKLALKSFAGKYVSISIDGMDEATAEAGKPSLPCKSIVFELPKNVEVTEVGVVNVEYKRFYVSGKIKPSPQPLPFIADYMRFVNTTEPSREDPETYESISFYPGTLLNYHVGRSLSKTYVFVKFYPFQYSPRNQLLLVITQADIVVAYRSVSSVNGQSLIALGDAGAAQYVIITSSGLEAAAQQLAIFYSARGVNTAVVTTEWIYRNYPPAENITMYPGFYTFKPLEPDPYYELLSVNYNWTLALKIISFLRDVAAHPFLTHVLLLGPSNRIPPSFYYLSYMDYLFDKWFGWVPTDMFYASPDYDLIPNYAVGRIPVGNPEQATYVINKIRAWYSSVSANPEWFRKAFLLGGYPFGYIFMHGESFVSKLLKEGYVRKLNTNAMYRTDYTYNRSSVLNCLGGGSGWAFMVAHGSGNAVADMLYDERLGAMTLEWLADTWDLAALRPNPAVPIVMSVACLNGAWDEEVLPPPWFRPPSFGKACLLSPAGGIAYIGASRLAWAMPLYNLNQGVLNVEDPLACQYLACVLKAYNASQTPITLGEVVSRGVLDYLGRVGPREYGLTTIMVFQLLGDPYLTLPVFDKPFKPERIVSVEVANPAAQVSVESIAPYLYGWRNVEGTLPYVPTSQQVIELKVKASEASLIRVNLTRILGWEGGYHERLAGYIRRPSVEAPVVGGFAYGKVDISFLTSGHLLFKVRSGQDEWRVYVLSYGVSASKTEAPSGSQLTLTAQGLDVLGPPGAEAVIEFGGNFIAYVTLDRFGVKEKKLIVPWAEPGDYNITIYIRSSQSPYGHQLPQAFCTVKVLISGAFATLHGNILYVNTTLGVIAARLEDVKATVVDVKGGVATINTTLGTVKVSLSDLNAKVAGINGTVATLSTTLGTVRTSVDAIDAKLISLDGTVATVRTTVGDVKTSVANIGLKVSAVNGTVAKIETVLGAIEGKIISIDGNVAAIKTEVGTVVADISDLQTGVTRVSDALSEVKPPIWVAVALSLITAAAAIYAIMIMHRRMAG